MEGSRAWEGGCDGCFTIQKGHLCTPSSSSETCWRGAESLPVSFSGMHVSIGCPQGYEPNAAVMDKVRQLANDSTQVRPVCFPASRSRPFSATSLPLGQGFD
jgi:hypothetical protein